MKSAMGFGEDTDINATHMLVEQAPAFPGLRCVKFCEIVNGPVELFPGDQLQCVVDTHDKKVRVVQDFDKRMTIRYVGIYEIENYGGIAGMFFERNQITIHP